MSGGILGPRAQAQLRDMYRKMARLRPGVTPDEPKRKDRKNKKRVAIIGTLAAPTGVLSTPTTCVAAVLSLNPTTKLLTVTDERITVHNYDPSVTAEDGMYGKVEFQGVWELYWLSCSPSTGLTELEENPETPPPEPI